MDNKLDYTVEVVTMRYGLPEVFVKFDADVTLWARPYSILVFTAIFQDVVEAAEMPVKLFYQPDKTSDPFSNFGISMEVNNENCAIKDVVEDLVFWFNNFQTTVEFIATESVDTDSLVTHFNFPEEIKMACKQYLIYFSQFLLDLGIEVKTEVDEKAGQTLFKVMPLNKNVP